MSLEDTLKELRALKEAEESGEQEVEQKEEKQPEPEKEEKAEEPKKEEPKVEELKAEEKPDDGAFARMRRENKAMKERLERLERGEEEAKSKQKPDEDGGEEEGDRVELPAEVVSLVERDRMTRAEQEFQSLEVDFRVDNPEYDDIAAQYVQAKAYAIKVANPRITNAQLTAKTKEAILHAAGEYARQGLNPVEEMYADAKALGFKPRPKVEEVIKEEKAETKKEIKPDMKQVADNRKRSAGMADAGGKEEGLVTKQSAADMSVAEWAKLPTEEKRRLMYGA